MKRILYDMGFKFEPPFGPGSKHIGSSLRPLMEFFTFLPSPEKTINFIVRYDLYDTLQ